MLVFLSALRFSRYNLINLTLSVLLEITMQEHQDHMAKGEFLNVSLYSTPSSCDMAPLGLSKYSHLADGCMDLILVHNTERKEFMRFLKRHGNAKNQVLTVACLKLNNIFLNEAFKKIQK